MFIKRMLKRNFVKYIGISLSSFFIELLIFDGLYYVLYPLLQDPSIIVATIIARILSSIYSYYMNAYFVFKRYSHKILFKYVNLVIINMAFSALLVYFAKKIWGIYPGNIKIVVDFIIFFVNYLIQRKVVFK